MFGESEDGTVATYRTWQVLTVNAYGTDENTLDMHTNHAISKAAYAKAGGK